MNGIIDWYTTIDSASKIIYDDIYSLGLSNVQDVLDYLYEKSIIAALDVGYDNSVSGMSAVNVQDAIDQLVFRLGQYNPTVYGMWVCGYIGTGNVATTHKFSIDNLDTVVVGPDFAYVSNAPAAQCSNGSLGRGVVGGGFDDPAFYSGNYYIDIVNGSTWVYFGANGTGSGVYNGVSNGVNDIGLTVGGMVDDVMKYQISVPADAVFFINLPTAYNSHACDSNGTNERALVIGGEASSSPFSGITDVVYYFTINIASSCTLFGYLSGVRSRFDAGGNKENDRTVVGGGGTDDNGSYNTDIIETFTFSTLSNAVYFGNLTVSRSNLVAVDNGKKGRVVFGYGWSGSTIVAVSDYVQVDTPSNAVAIGLDMGNIINRAGISNFA